MPSGPLTFTQDIHDVPPLQGQVLGPPGRVVVLGHHLVEGRSAACSLWWEGGAAGWAGREKGPRVPRAPHGDPHPCPAETHPALEPQGPGAGRCVSPGPLQRLLPGEGDPAPLVARVSVTAKRLLRVAWRVQGLFLAGR